jgi:RecB family exonuclease
MFPVMSTQPPIGLTLILGPANSGKLGQVLEWWQTRLHSRPLIVVPTGPDARSLSREMAQRAGALVGQSGAVTFDGLVRLLLRRPEPYAGEFERSLLISTLLHEHPPQASGFSARFPGMVSAVSSLLEQLGDSGRSPEEIGLALQRWGSEDPESASLAADIRGLMTGYRALRDRLGLADRSDSVREALTMAAGCEQPLAFYGFTSFTYAQRRLVAALAEKVEVLLVFDHEQSRVRGLTTPDELAYWQGLAVDRQELRPQALAYTSDAVRYLERRFMDDDPDPEPPPPAQDETGGVRFLLASGQRNEAEAAAEQVTALIRSGLRPGDIAVVVRHMKMWGRLLEDVFVSCDIPCQVDERFTLDETGLGHAFLTGLRGVAADDPHQVLEYLRSPYSGLTLEQASDLELDYLRQTARGVDALTDHAHPPVRARLYDLEAAVQGRRSEAVVRLDAAQALARSMLQNGLRGSDPCSVVDSGDAAADSRAFRALQKALSGLVVHGTNGVLPADALRLEVLLTTLARTAVPGGELGSEDAVQILTVHRARARRFQAVLILGLVEGEFPGRSDRPALLTQEQRDRLDAAGGGLFSPETDQEEALFVRAVSRAWRYLFLSSRDADDGGGYAGQSYYWSHCKELLRVGEHEHVHRSLADQVFDLAGAPTPRQYLRGCAARGLAPPRGCGLPTLVPPQWARPGEGAGLASGEVLAQLSATQSFGPSSLEKYLTCPFMWFVDKVVGVEDLETVVDDRLVGQLLHKVLSDTFQELRGAGVLPLKAEALPFAEGVAAAVIEALVDGEECPGGPAERRLSEHKLKRLVADLFAMEVSMRSSRTLVDTEVGVGGKSGVDIGGLAVGGRIDRVDSAASGELFIIDYKSSSLPAKRDIGTAQALQLPLYILALAAERPEQPVAGGMYLSPKKQESVGVIKAACEEVAGTTTCRVVDDDEWDEMLQSALLAAQEAAEGIRAGRIAPRSDRSCPDWCRLGPVCRARRGGRSYRR